MTEVLLGSVIAAFGRHMVVRTVDGTELEPVEHLREAAVEAAIAQDAEVISINHYPDLGPFQGIGALLRF